MRTLSLSSTVSLKMWGICILMSQAGTQRIVFNSSIVFAAGHRDCAGRCGLAGAASASCSIAKPGPEAC